MRLGRAVAFLVERTGVRARLQEMWRRDIARSVGAADRHTGVSISKLKRRVDDSSHAQRLSVSTVRDLEQQLAVSVAIVRELESRLTRLERTALADSRQAQSVAEWQSRFGSDAISEAVSRTIAAAPLREEPAAHLLVERIFPPDFYALVVDTLQNGDDAGTAESPEIDLRPTAHRIVPRLTAVAWGFIDARLADAIARAALERFRPFIERYYVELFGRECGEAVLALPHEASARFQRWPRGYSETPHLDPKGTVITVLMYLARPGDSLIATASLYSIDGDFAPVHTNTAYPDEHGVHCRLVSRVPLRHNSALLTVNAGAAHRIDLQQEDGQTDTDGGYGLELRIGPNVRQFVDLISTLPPADQQPWLGLAASLVK